MTIPHGRPWVVVGVVIGLAIFLGWPVSSRQGMNYEVRAFRLPLYVKLIDFLSRDAHYRRLAREITAGARTPTERALALFSWTTTHVHQQPDTLPVMDDHVWYTVVRGYGMPDQVVEVLTTLCSYAGVAAIRYPARTADGRGRLNVAAVWLDGHWRLLDPYHGIILRDRDGALATFEQLQQNPALVREQTAGRRYKGREYAQYFEALQPIAARVEIKAGWQHPWQRVWLELMQLVQRVC